MGKIRVIHVVLTPSKYSDKERNNQNINYEQEFLDNKTFPISGAVSSLSELRPLESYSDNGYSFLNDKNKNYFNNGEDTSSDNLSIQHHTHMKQAEAFIFEYGVIIMWGLDLHQKRFIINIIKHHESNHVEPKILSTDDYLYHELRKFFFFF